MDNELNNKVLSVDEYEGYVSPSTDDHTLEPNPDPEPDHEIEPYNNTLEPVAYDLRFTFSNQDKELKCLEDTNYISRCKRIFLGLIQRLNENGYFHRGKYIGGFETKNRTGETCKAHIHLRFYSTKISNTIRRTIKRYLTETFDENTTGNNAMMFKPRVVRDKLEFMRYPLKQGLSYKFCSGYKKEELQLMYETAKDSYLKTVQINQSKMDKLDKTDTLFSRVLELLKKDISTTTTKTPRDIYKQFLQIYVEENRPVNEATIKGYSINAMIKLNMMTIDQLLDKWGV